MVNKNINKDEIVKELTREILDFISKGELDEAEKKAIDALSDYPNSFYIYDLIGTINVKKNRFDKAEQYFKKAISINPNFLNAIHNMGVVQIKLSKHNNALKYFEKAIEINPKFFTAFNNIGLIFNQQLDHDKAISNFKKAINYKNDYAEAYFNLGVSYQKTTKYKEAIINYNKAIKYKENYYDAFFNLGEIYKIMGSYDKALTSFKKSKNIKTNSRVIECLFALGHKKDYQSSIDFLTKKDPENRRIAAISTYASNQLEIINSYPFCPNPLDYILTKNILISFNEYNNFFQNLFNEIVNQSFIWEPHSRTTVNGFVSKGNLSDLKLSKMLELEEIFRKEISNYKSNYGSSDCKYINSWPKNFKFMSWSNRLKKEGYNIPHIHPSGWLSGVFYLRMPKNIKGNEGAIEFSLHGDNYKIIKKEIPKKVYIPNEGDLVMFPSSLYHRTIPFSSNEERVCIAFDIIPN